MRPWIYVLLMAMMVGCGSLKGPQGDAGPRGVPGATGPTGLSPSDLVSVQFCPGTTHNPDTYCEVTYCYGGRLYLAYLPNAGYYAGPLEEGEHTTSGVNCGCTFTLTGCSVTN